MSAWYGGYLSGRDAWASDGKRDVYILDIRKSLTTRRTMVAKMEAVIS